MARNRPVFKPKKGETKTKRCEGFKPKGLVGVSKSDVKNPSKARTKRTNLLKGPRNTSQTKIANSRREGLRRTTVTAGNDIVDAKIETASKANSKNGHHPSPTLVTPVLQRTIPLAANGNRPFKVFDIVSMTPDILVVVGVGGQVRAINLQKDFIISELKLPNSSYVSKLDDNTVIFLSGIPRRQVEFVKVMPKLQLTKNLLLENSYRCLIVLDKDTFLGLRRLKYDTPIEMLNMSGQILRTVRPKILKGLSLQGPTYLLVKHPKQIAVIDRWMNLLISFPVSGKAGFAYCGPTKKYCDSKLTDMEDEEFQKTAFSLVKPTTMSYDSKGNLYLAGGGGIVVKLDPSGNFVQNVLPLKRENLNRNYMIKYTSIHIDDKDHLYYSDNDDNIGTLVVYEI